MFNVSLDTAVSAPSIKTIQYIPLETNDSSLIGEVSKIICRNHRFYILDKRQNQVLVFGEKGDFITSIHRVGNGPDEYVMDYDMDIDSMGRIYIADVSQQCIVRYSGAHYDQCHRIKVGKTFLEFTVSTPEQIYLSGVSQTEGVIDVGLASFDTERNRLDALEKSLYGDELATMLFSQQHLFRSADRLLFYKRYSSHIYRLAEGGKTPYLFLDTGKIPTAEKVDTWRKDRQPNPTVRETSIRDISALYETDSLVYMTLQTFPPSYALFSKSEGRAVCFSFIDDKRYWGNMGAYTVSGNRFVSYCLPKPELIGYILKNNVLSSGLSQQIASLSENDNPLLVLYDFVWE